MKKILKLMFINFSLICCLIIGGCSCSKPMNVKYAVTTGQGSLENQLTSNIVVNAVVTKKFREPADTPCYKKMKGGSFVKLETSGEKQECTTKDCFKKEKGSYVKMNKDSDATACIMGKFDCYEEVKETYYKLLVNPDGVSACYTKDGEYFERATYNAVEKVELEKAIPISTTNNKLSYESSYLEVPKNKTYSLIYDFEITNKENKILYIAAIDFEDITGGVIKEESYSKITMTIPEEKIFLTDGYYYEVGAGKTITIRIEIKNLLTTDAKAKSTKNLTLNIPVIVK